MKLYRITNHLKNETFYVGTAPQARRYVLEAPDSAMIDIEEFEWTYKYQLVQIVNEAMKFGQEFQRSRWERVEDGEVA